jgi:hypothetical protein
MFYEEGAYMRREMQMLTKYKIKEILLTRELHERCICPLRMARPS